MELAFLCCDRRYKWPSGGWSSREGWCGGDFGFAEYLSIVLLPSRTNREFLRVVAEASRLHCFFPKQPPRHHLSLPNTPTHTATHTRNWVSHVLIILVIHLFILVHKPCCRNGWTGATRGDERLQEDPDQAGLGDGCGHDGVPTESGAAHCAGHHGDPTGCLDTHCGQDGRRLWVFNRVSKISLVGNRWPLYSICSLQNPS